MKTVSISKESSAAANTLLELYKAGKVFAAKDNPEIQRSCEVYLAASKLADEIGKDLAKTVGGDATGHGHYELIHNMKAIIRRRVGAGKCAVGIYDFDDGACYYIGLVSC